MTVQRVVRLASGPQLWRLNQAGRLTITDHPVDPIDVADAWQLVNEIALGTDDTTEHNELDAA